MRNRALLGVAAGLSALTIGAGIASAQSDDDGGTDDTVVEQESTTTDDSTTQDREGCEDGGGAGGPGRAPGDSTPQDESTS